MNFKPNYLHFCFHIFIKYKATQSNVEILSNMYIFFLYLCIKKIVFNVLYLQ